LFRKIAENIDHDEWIQIGTNAANIMKTTSSLLPVPEWHIGQTIHIIDGPFIDFTGEIYEIRAEQKKLRVKIDLFGRKTPVELEFSQVEAIDAVD